MSAIQLQPTEEPARPGGGLPVAHRLVRMSLLPLLRVAVRGTGLVPGAGGVLLAANHRSFLDHFLLAAAAPRPVRFLGKSELDTPVAGRVYRWCGMVPVERGVADVAALQRVVDLLAAGEVVGIFPEGSRSRSGELHRFRSGAARVAAAACVPTVPVGLRGTAEVWPTGARPRPGTLRARPLEVRFGAPMPPPAAEARARRPFTLALEREVARLSEQSLNGGFAPVAASQPG